MQVLCDLQVLFLIFNCQTPEEVKGGTSDIPVVKFEKQKRGAEGQKKPEKKGGYDTNEMAVLQEMMSEFFG